MSLEEVMSEVTSTSLLSGINAVVCTNLEGNSGAGD